MIFAFILSVSFITIGCDSDDDDADNEQSSGGACIYPEDHTGADGIAMVCQPNLTESECMAEDQNIEGYEQRWTTDACKDSGFTKSCDNGEWWIENDKECDQFF